MYMCRLRHIKDPVLSSLKMEGIRLLFVTEKEYVFCAVQNLSVITSQVTKHFKIYIVLNYVTMRFMTGKGIEGKAPLF
jgi:hypothetical protein